MSATTANNNKNQPAPARTTGRGAPVCITLGIFLLTLGCAWGISLIAGRDGYAMSQLCQMVQGLAGPLCVGARPLGPVPGHALFGFRIVNLHGSNIDPVFPGQQGDQVFRPGGLSAAAAAGDQNDHAGPPFSV